MKSRQISRRAASPLTRFKTRDNIEEVFVEYNDDPALFSRRAESQQWESRSTRLNQQADILNANVALTREKSVDIRLALQEVDAELKKIIDREDEFLEPDQIDDYPLAMHENFEGGSIFSENDNLDSLELCSSAFDELALYIQDEAISGMLQKIKNVILERAARKTCIQVAEERANVILDQKLSQEMATMLLLEAEADQLKTSLDDEKARYQRLERDYLVVEKLQLKYEADASIQEQTNISLTRINAELVRDGAKKAEERDEYMERTRRLTRVIQKLKNQQDNTFKVLERTDEQLKGCKNERDDLLQVVAGRDVEIAKLKLKLEKSEKIMEQIRLEHSQEKQRLLDHIEMGNSVAGIQMEDVDNDIMLSECIKDGVASLVLLSDENKEEILHEEFGVDRYQLFNLKYVLAHLRDVSLQDKMTHFFETDYLDQYVQQASKAIQVATESQNQRIVYKYVATADPTTFGSGRGAQSGRHGQGNLTSRERGAKDQNIGEIPEEMEIEAVRQHRSDILARLTSSRVTEAYNTADALPGYEGSLQQNVLRRKNSVLSFDSLSSTTKCVYHEHEDFQLQLRHLEQNINSTISLIGKNSSDDFDMIEWVGSSLAEGVEESERHYAEIARKICGEVETIVDDVSVSPRLQEDMVLEYLEKKSKELSTILNIPLGMLQNALEEVSGLKGAVMPPRDENGSLAALNELNNISDQSRSKRARMSNESLSFSISDSNLELSELVEIVDNMELKQVSQYSFENKETQTFFINDANSSSCASLSKTSCKKSILDQMHEVHEIPKLAYSSPAAQGPAVEGSELATVLQNPAEAPPPLPQQRSNPKISFIGDHLVDADISEDLDSSRWKCAYGQAGSGAGTIVGADAVAQPASEPFKPGNATRLEKAIEFTQNNSGEFLVCDIATSAERRAEDMTNEKQRKIRTRNQVSRKTSARPMSAFSDVVSRLRENATESIVAKASCSTLHEDRTMNTSGSIYGKQNLMGSGIEYCSEDHCHVVTDASVHDYCELNQAQPLNLEKLEQQLEELSVEEIQQLETQLRLVITSQEETVETEFIVPKERIFDVMSRSSYQQTETIPFRDFQMQTDRTVENSISDQVIFKDMMSMIECASSPPDTSNLQERLEKTPLFIQNQIRSKAQRQELVNQCAIQNKEESGQLNTASSRLEERFKNAQREGKTTESQVIFSSSSEGPRNQQVVQEPRIAEENGPPGVLPKLQRPNVPDVLSGLDDAIAITEPLFLRTDQATIKKHPYAGEFVGYSIRSLLDPPLMEQFMLQFAVDRAYYRFLPLSSEVENAYFAPAVIADVPDSALLQHNMHSETRRCFQNEICRVTGTEICQKIKQSIPGSRSLLPQIGEHVGFVRLSACVISETGQFPQITELCAGERVFIRGCEYVRVPVRHAVLKPVAWVKSLIQALIRDRIACSVSQVCEAEVAENLNPSSQLEEARFSVLPGQIDAAEALSMVQYAVYWTRQRYGAKTLVRAALWNLIVNATYWEHEDNDIYVFCRIFFNDLPQDFEELYFEIMRRAKVELAPLSPGSRNAAAGLRTLEVDSSPKIQQRQRQTIKLEQVSAFVKAIIPAFSDKRVEAFHSSVIAVQYQLQEQTDSSEVSQDVDFSTFVSMLLFAYASYRKSSFQAVVQILKFFGRDLKESTFREFIGLLGAGLRSFTVTEIFHVYQQDGILRFDDVGKLFCEFELARFCAIEAKTLQQVIGNDIQRMTNSCAIVYQRMQASARKMQRYMSRVHQERLKASFEVLQTDILVYDVTSCITGFQLVIQLIIQSIGEKAPDACLAVIAGTVSSLNEVISDV